MGQENILKFHCKLSFSTCSDSSTECAHHLVTTATWNPSGTSVSVRCLRASAVAAPINECSKKNCDTRIMEYRRVEWNEGKKGLSTIPEIVFLFVTISFFEVCELAAL